MHLQVCTCMHVECTYMRRPVLVHNIMHIIYYAEKHSEDILKPIEVQLWFISNPKLRMYLGLSYIPVNDYKTGHYFMILIIVLYLGH